MEVMKILLVCASVLVLLQYVAAGESEHDVDHTDDLEVLSRMRRSSKFDSNQMKGKYAKSNKHKRSVDAVEDLIHPRGTEREVRNVVKYLSPTPTLFLAANAPPNFKVPKSPPPA